MHHANQLTASAQQLAVNTVANADRPWIGVSHVDAIQPAPGQQMGAVITFLNSGKTPAFDVSVESGTGILSVPPNPPFTIVNTVKNQMVAFPTQEFIVNDKTSTPLSAEQVADIQAGRTWFAIGSNVSYADQYRRRHVTTFCAFYNVTNKTFSTCEKGNTAN
jgi:hypothetical protein